MEAIPSKQKHKRAKVLYRSFIILLLSTLFITSCSQGGTVPLVHQLGTYGADFATEIAREFPSRIAGSSNERAVAEKIVEEFERLGFEPEIQEFTLANGNTSQNVVVRIPGSGFVADEDSIDQFDYEVYNRRAQAADGVFRRHVVIGARYDTTSEPPTGHDGISDNASGVGALMLTAQTLKRYAVGYDVSLVALGAGFSNIAGATHYVESLKDEELAQTDVFYEYRSLYGGGKLYGHAGWSSLYPNAQYKMRQPLYEIADIAINYSLFGRTGHVFYTNQSTYSVSNPVAEEPVPEGFTAPNATAAFREFSHTPSDYRAFDRVGIPIVFFESYDYSASSFDALEENNNPNFQETENIVRGTSFDNIAKLREENLEDYLAQRINNTVYLVYIALTQGVLGGSEYSLRNIY